MRRNTNKWEQHNTDKLNKDSRNREEISRKKQFIEIMKAVAIAIMGTMLTIVLFVGVLATETQTAAAKESAKSLCAAALKATGGSSKLKYKSENAMDFAAFSSTDCKKVSSIMYICDEKEAYSICLVQAQNNAGAKALLKKIKAYKKANTNSNYLSDYSSTEQKVFKNAVCGKKGKYIWYISMSDNKADNHAGQSAIKKLLP